MRESKVETHLHKAVTAAGGTTRKFSSATRPNNPDRIVIWPREYHQLETSGTQRGLKWVHGIKCEMQFVECKAPGKKARPGQDREHHRLRKLGCQVFVLDTIEKVDHYVERNR